MWACPTLRQQRIANGLPAVRSARTYWIENAMISCPTVEKKVIRSHYDITTLFYRLLWGKHIHHGLWSADESPRVAQQQLTEAMLAEAAIPRGARLLDVGCGMGGSSIYLAGIHDCQVTGVTLSPFQRRWASIAARYHGVSKKTDFQCVDAESAVFADDTFDAVWSIECTEHLFEKSRFFQNAAHWVRPGGRVAICAWLAGDEPYTERGRQLVYDVCEGFFCPSLGTSTDYEGWLSDAGLNVDRVLDWTSQVSRTWEICEQRVRRTGMPFLAKLIDQDTQLFLRRFQTILEAYRTGAMRYGCFIASKPD